MLKGSGGLGTRLAEFIMTIKSSLPLFWGGGWQEEGIHASSWCHKILFVHAGMMSTPSCLVS